MSTSVRAGVLAAGSFGRAAVSAPNWRAVFAHALAREVEERRFFLWLPVACMGGVALNLAADREPVLWLPAALTALFAALAFFSRARPVALGLSLALAALSPDFFRCRCAPARVGAPVLDRIRIASLRGYVEEVDLRPVGARMVIAVMSADGMPREKAPRRVRVTTRKAPERRRRRLCGAQGAAAAALACGAARRLRFRPRRVLRRRRRGRLDARRDPGSAAAGRRDLGGSASAPRSIMRATVSRSGSTASSAATRARSPPRW